MDPTDPKYVSLVTYRRSGEAVPVPVWIVPLPDGRGGFTTDGSSGKVKRIRNNPSVAVRPCDLRGKVADDAPEFTARAEVVAPGEADFDDVHRGLRHKYGIQYVTVELGSKLKSLLRRDDHTVAVVLTFPAAS